MRRFKIVGYTTNLNFLSSFEIIIEISSDVESALKQFKQLYNETPVYITSVTMLPM